MDPRGASLCEGVHTTTSNFWAEILTLLHGTRCRACVQVGDSECDEETKFELIRQECMRGQGSITASRRSPASALQPEPTNTRFAGGAIDWLCADFHLGISVVLWR